MVSMNALCLLKLLNNQHDKYNYLSFSRYMSIQTESDTSKVLQHYLEIYYKTLGYSIKLTIIFSIEKNCLCLVNTFLECSIKVTSSVYYVCF